MVWLKACPRCGGDLFEERDWYTRTIKCFQCGRALNPAQERELKIKSAATKEREKETGGQNSDAPKRRKRTKAA